MLKKESLRRDGQSLIQSFNTLSSMLGETKVRKGEVKMSTQVIRPQCWEVTKSWSRPPL